MAIFTYYNSADSGSPVLTGDSGSLIDLLDACLVNGYASKTAVGWTKPIANSTNPHAGCWKQPSGSKFILYVNDSAPNLASTSGTREAWATGWETISNITTPVGTGSGQFPLPAQQLTTGHVMVRKSNTNTSVRREWVMYADDRTFYLFTATGDIASTYTGLFFGDFYSLKTDSSDVYKCMIHSRYTEASSTSTGDLVDEQNAINNNAANGFFTARTVGGAGGSIITNKIMCFYGFAGNSPLAGTIQTPNSADNSLYITPLYVSEAGSNILRGRLRGMYGLWHTVASFGDGQTFSGGNEYAGKTFQIVKQGYNVGMWAIEISNTVETNA